MGTQITPTYRADEFDHLWDEGLIIDLNNRNARTMFEQILEVPFEPTGSELPATIILASDDIMVRAAAMDAVAPIHAIEGYWQLRAASLLSAARWAEAHGRDIVWS